MRCFVAVVAVLFLSPLGAARAHAGDITINFSDFPSNLPEGSGVTTYSTQGYFFYTTGNGNPYLYQVAQPDPYYFGTNALGFESYSENAVFVQLSGDAFNFSGVSFATFPADESGPITVSIQATINGEESVVATETVTATGVLQAFTPQIANATAIAFSAVDSEGNPAGVQFTNLVVTAASDPPGTPEPSSVVMLGIGAAMIVVWSRRRPPQTN